MRWLTVFLLSSLIACKTVDPESSRVGACKMRETAVSADGLEVRLQHYTPAVHRDRAIVILPPTGGATFLESRYASLFCEGGFGVYLIEGWTGMDEKSVELSIHSELFGRAQRAIAQVLEAAPEGFLGLLGTSVGGLHAATAVGHLERASAAFVIAAGAPVADVIAYTDQGALESLGDRRMREFDFESRSDYRDALAATFDWEPLDVARAARSKPLGMVVVRNDRTVPTARQEQLRDAWRPRVAHSVSGFPLGGHTVGIVQAWWLHSRDILDFFLEGATGAAS